MRERTKRAHANRPALDDAMARDLLREAIARKVPLKLEGDEVDGAGDRKTEDTRRPVSKRGLRLSQAGAPSTVSVTRT